MEFLRGNAQGTLPEITGGSVSGREWNGPVGMEALESQPKEGRDGICSEGSGSDQVASTPTQVKKTLSCMSLDPTLVQQSTPGPALSPAPCDQPSENPL